MHVSSWRGPVSEKLGTMRRSRRWTTHYDMHHTFGGSGFDVLSLIGEIACWVVRPCIVFPSTLNRIGGDGECVAAGFTFGPDSHCQNECAGAMATRRKLVREQTNREARMGGPSGRGLPPARHLAAEMSPMLTAKDTKSTSGKRASDGALAAAVYSCGAV